MATIINTNYPSLIRIQDLTDTEVNFIVSSLLALTCKSNTMANIYNLHNDKSRLNKQLSYRRPLKIRKSEYAHFLFFNECDIMKETMELYAISLMKDSLMFNEIWLDYNTIRYLNYALLEYLDFICEMLERLDISEAHTKELFNLINVLGDAKRILKKCLPTDEELEEPLGEDE